ncbi:MAG TPA: phosphohydrolase, partial [Bacteroidales bacterium]|nr:phosphohydrolase [Bacteroidales bacterium]
VDDQLVVEGKGIYSIEKFIISRRLMYWQVYLHKTVVAAEYMLVNILKRAKELASEDIPLFGSPVLHLFLYSDITIENFLEDRKWIEDFARLDDYDILSAIKVWTTHRDPILSYLCKSLVDRHLYKVEIQNEPFDVQYLASLKEKTAAQFRLKEEDVSYFLVEGTVTNNAYNPEHDRIRIQFRNNELVDVSEASDQLNISVLSTPVSKYLLCYPKNLVT